MEMAYSVREHPIDNPGFKPCVIRRHYKHGLYTTLVVGVSYTIMPVKVGSFLSKCL